MYHRGVGGEEGHAPPGVGVGILGCRSLWSVCVGGESMCRKSKLVYELHQYNIVEGRGSAWGPRVLVMHLQSHPLSHCTPVHPPPLPPWPARCGASLMAGPA